MVVFEGEPRGGRLDPGGRRSLVSRLLKPTEAPRWISSKSRRVMSIDACENYKSPRDLNTKILINDRRNVQPPKTRKSSPQSIRSSDLSALRPDGDLARRLLAGEDILACGEDGGPVLEGGVGHATALAESDKIYGYLSVPIVHWNRSVIR